MLGSYIVKSSDEFKSADRPSFISLGAGTDTTSDPHTLTRLVQDKGRIPVCGSRKVSESFLGLTTGFSGLDISGVDSTPDRIYLTGPYTTTECGYVKELRFYGRGIASNDNSHRGVIYEDIGGTPTNLIGSSSISATSVVTNLWNRVVFEEEVHIEKLKSYWIGVMNETEATRYDSYWVYGSLEKLYPQQVYWN
jgi:hypothetical protein